MKAPGTSGRQPAVDPESRKQLLGDLRLRLQEGARELCETYQAKQNSKLMLRGRCRLVDSILTDLWASSGLPHELALVAVGGYGRGELFPASDVDLLILLPETTTPDTQRRLEEVIGSFWDIGLDIGHSVRTVAECLAESSRDITVQTSLLEARQLSGSEPLFRQLQVAMRAQLDAGSFFSAKHLEQEQRYTR